MPSPRPGSRRPPRSWVWLLGLVITVLLLWWAVHDVSLTEVTGHLRAAKPWALALIAVTATLQFPLKAVRWRAILAATAERPGVGPLWHATAIGAMANNLLPARAGEVIRVYVATRLTSVRLSTTVAAAALERVIDAAVILALMAIPLLGSRLQGASIDGRSAQAVLQSLGLLAAGLVLVAGVAGLLPGVMTAVAHRLVSLVLPAKMRAGALRLIDGLLQGFAALRNPKLAIAAIGWTAAVWIAHSSSFWVAVIAFDLDVPIAGAFLINGLIAFGVALPSSPGFFGLFEATAKISLMLYGVDAARAVSYAVGYHIISFVPITLLGMWSLRSAHIGFLELSHLRNRAEANAEEDASPAAPDSGPTS